jgi:ribose 5-phosphate isomerase B
VGRSWYNGHPMATVALASDHAGVDLKAQLVEELNKAGHEVVDLGPATTASVDYPDFAAKVADAIVSGRAAIGVLVCGTGIGMSITANKVAGIRAALCRTEFEARMSRMHNDANVLCLGQRVTGVGLAVEILKAFLGASFEGGRHAGRVEKIRALEARR